MHPTYRWAVLATVCASVYLINLDITIVNAALPTLVRELDAGTRDLQRIVDAYNLTFAAFGAIALGAVASDDHFTVIPSLGFECISVPTAAT